MSSRPLVKMAWLRVGKRGKKCSIAKVLAEKGRLKNQHGTSRGLNFDPEAAAEAVTAALAPAGTVDTIYCAM